MKKYLMFLMLQVFVSELKAQVSIQPVIPLAGMIQKDNLWNIAVINNSGAALNCRIELTLRDRTTGLEVLTATTGQFEIAAGAKQVSASQLAPIQYNWISSTITARNDDFIPIGNYIACYHLTGGKNETADECSSFDVEPLSPPMLITPVDSSVLVAAPSQFTWIPPTPINLFSRLQYDVVITEILPGQKPEEAVQQNIPFYSENGIPSNTMTYRGQATDFEKDKWYAWQVEARDENNYAGKTEVWVFKVTDEIKSSIVEETPFTKMKRDNTELAIAPNGILKISYHNELPDSIVRITVQNLNADSKKPVKPAGFDSKITHGDNFIAYDLKKIMHPEENKVYSAELINSRNEKFSVRFTVKYFKNN